MKLKTVGVIALLVLVGVLVGTRLWLPLETLALEVQSGEVSVLEAVNAFCQEVIVHD